MGMREPESQHNRPGPAVGTACPKGPVNDDGPHGSRRVARAGG